MWAHPDPWAQQRRQSKQLPLENPASLFTQQWQNSKDHVRKQQGTSGAIYHLVMKVKEEAWLQPPSGILTLPTLPGGQACESGSWGDAEVVAGHTHSGLDSYRPEGTEGTTHTLQASESWWAAPQLTSEDG